MNKIKRKKEAAYETLKKEKQEKRKEEHYNDSKRNRKKRNKITVRGRDGRTRMQNLVFSVLMN